MNIKKINLIKFISMLLLVCITIQLSAVTHRAKASENQWTTENFSLPISLNGACVEYINGKIYVIGGQKGTFSPVDTVHIYDFKTKTWSNGSPLPQPKAFSTSNVINGKIYIIGGVKLTATNKYNSTNDVDIYDIATDTWSKGSTMPLLTSHVKSVLYKNNIYIFGGINSITGQVNTFHKSIQIYNVQNNTWTSNSMPFARCNYTLNLIDDKVYLIGGNQNDVYYNDVKVYDLLTNTWNEGSKMNNIRQTATSTAYNNKIYVYGGNNPTLLNTTEIYDVETDTWSKGSNITTGRRFANSFIANNKIYLVGGEIITSPLTFTDKIESLQLPYDVDRLFAHLYLNEKTQLSFTNNLSDNQNYIWKSSSPNIASVDNTGMVTAHEVGTTYISAYNQNDIFVDFIPVIVTESDVHRLAVYLNVGQRQKLYFNNNPDNVTWSSMDNSVVTVSTNGEVTGISKGLAIVKAEWNGNEHYIYIRVS